MSLLQILVERVSSCCLREEYSGSGRQRSVKKQVLSSEQDHITPFLMRLFYGNKFILLIIL